jgi:hypothetical protein
LGQLSGQAQKRKFDIEKQKKTQNIKTGSMRTGKFLHNRPWAQMCRTKVFSEHFNDDNQHAQNNKMPPGPV